ncbi:MAG: SCP2 domain-containing protein [Gammaproteobacteria bacterium]
MSALPTPDWTALAARLLDAALAHDPDTRARFAALAGRVYAIDLEGMRTTIYLEPKADGVHLARACDRPPDVAIRGTPLNLLAYMRQRARGAAPTVKVQVSGDLAAAQAFQTLAAGLDIDWEGWAARYVGDIAAHQLGRAAGGFGRWLRAARASLAANVAEYARHEAGILPLPGEVDRFLSDVDTLRDDVERLEARIARLERPGAASR